MKKIMFVILMAMATVALFAAGKGDRIILTQSFNASLGWSPTGALTWVKKDSVLNIDGTSYAKLMPFTSANNVRVGTLTSPQFDATLCSNLYVDFDQKSLFSGNGTQGTLEYTTDGVNWTQIFIQTVTIGDWAAPKHESILVPNLSATMQVRFIGSLKGMSGSTWNLDNIVIHGADRVPDPPVLSLPSNGVNTSDFTPTFDWYDAVSATSYTILVDNNSDYSSPEINQSPGVSTYSPVTDLAPGTYYWKVFATNSYGSSSYSASWTVNLGNPPSSPSGTFAPGDGFSTTDPSPFFDWEDVAGATSYIIYIDNNSDMSSPEVTGTPSVSEYTPSDLPPGTYYWTITAVNEFGESIGSTVLSFTINLTAPVNLVTSETGGDLTITWDAVPYATSYNVYTSADPYGTFVYTANVPTNSYTVPAATVRLFYRITASN